MIPRIFDGQGVVIVAGGPSLRPLISDPDPGALRRMLTGRNVIAINRAHEFLPEAQVLWWTDARYWRRSKESLLAHGARWKATSDVEYHKGEVPPSVFQYHFSDQDGLDDNPRNLRHGLNGAYAATNLAVHLGANRIVLLGVDLWHDGTPSGRNFHSGYDDVPPPEDATLNRWKATFATLAPILADRGIPVINGSVNSALKIWPRIPAEDAVSSLDPMKASE